MTEELAFLCHSSADSDYVCRVAGHLASHIELFYYEEHQRGDQSFIATLNTALSEATLGVIFWGDKSGESKYQSQEVSYLSKPVAGRSIVIVGIGGFDQSTKLPQKNFALIDTHPFFQAPEQPAECARLIIQKARRPGLLWKPDGLPANPHLFSYEKDIIRHYNAVRKLGTQLHAEAASEDEERERQAICQKILQGCPSAWPEVVDLCGGETHPNPLGDVFNKNGELIGSSLLGAFRPRQATVGATSLREYGDLTSFCFPEAGPRARLCFPQRGKQLKVGIVVSGGIAPGINAVIDGIVQRHWKYAGRRNPNHQLEIFGYRDGFYALRPGVTDHNFKLVPDEQHPKAGNPNYVCTSEHASNGGSILGTYRWDDLLDAGKRHAALGQVNSRLRQQGIDILYVIGGDGSMKAAHALWTVARADPERRTTPLSVVAIPKTMDNDILWMWQSFGFLSAVEKARETVQLLHTEVGSNPRICVLQLFGSDSGFVVSHAVVASATGQCHVALIPEVPFSMLGLARHLKQRICSQDKRKIPDALVVMAETAIPVDVSCYLGSNEDLEQLRRCGFSESEARSVRGMRADDLGLSRDEVRTLRDFDAARGAGRRIQGQTSDALRTAGVKIVTRVLPRLLPAATPPPGLSDPDWGNMRVFANEPRHLLRAIGPSTSDIIMGQRLGTLAVDNAMAGYTDFMISQWLTEFVLVPLELVVLGRKRIPDGGIFWKSVLAKTDQPGDLVAPWIAPTRDVGEERRTAAERRAGGDRRTGVERRAAGGRGSELGCTGE